MDLNIDNTIASKNVSISGVEGSSSVPFAVYRKTNPINPDSFSKETKTSQRPTLEQLYQKFLELFAPSTLLDNLLTESAVQKMIKANPAVKEILDKNNVALKVNLDNVKDIKEAHIDSTVYTAKGIAESMGLSMQDIDTVTKGARFHDFGKILIPSDLLNKNGKLEPAEKKIVDLHSQLGYELLKTTNINPEALEIVKNHHKPLNKQPDLKTQIVSVADIYSALRMKRAYKTTLTHDQSMTILRKYAEMGKIDHSIIDALDDFTSKHNVITESKPKISMPAA